MPPPPPPPAAPNALTAGLQTLPTQHLRGISLIAGRDGDPSPEPTARLFHSTSPQSGEPIPFEFRCATEADVETACRAAWEAFQSYGAASGETRAAFLDRIAAGIDGLGDDLIAWAGAETGLSASRLKAERDRTTFTLRMFASLVREGSWVRAAIDPAEPARKPNPRPDIRRMLRPLGPVAVFGAGNFPLAYSTAGGDTASALASGCPVVVKGHPGHPGTGELVARAIAAAAESCSIHPGVLSFLHAGGEQEKAVGTSLVRHPCIRAVGFTGSFSGGMALARLGTERPDPIPVFAEMGSTNPVFVLRHALQSQGESIAERLASSITSSNGQMCTCPGLIFVQRDEHADLFARALARLLDAAPVQPMLNRRTRDTLAKRLAEVRAVKGVESRAARHAHGPLTPADATTTGPITGGATLFRTTLDVLRAEPTLREECFGPAAILVFCESEQEMLEAATLVQGSLTGSIFGAAFDAAQTRKLQSILEQRVGRIIFNGVPTGVEVCHAMTHGGPYPATNQPHTTAVGPLAIERWCRPITYQNAPDQMLPPELKSDNPLGIERVANGVRTREAIKA